MFHPKDRAGWPDVLRCCCRQDSHRHIHRFQAARGRESRASRDGQHLKPTLIGGIGYLLFVLAQSELFVSRYFSSVSSLRLLRGISRFSLSNSKENLRAGTTAPLMNLATSADNAGVRWKMNDTRSPAHVVPTISWPEHRKYAAKYKWSVG